MVSAFSVTSISSFGVADGGMKRALMLGTLLQIILFFSNATGSNSPSRLS
jgi:hypothetical protein